MDGEPQPNGPRNRQSQNVLRSHPVRTPGDMLRVEKLSRSLIVVIGRLDNELAFLDTDSQVIFESCLARTLRRITSPSRSLLSYLVGAIACTQTTSTMKPSLICIQGTINLRTVFLHRKKKLRCTLQIGYSVYPVDTVSFLKAINRMRALPRRYLKGALIGWWFHIFDLDNQDELWDLFE